MGVRFHSPLSKFPGKQQIREQQIKHNYTSSQSTISFKTLLSHWPAIRFHQLWIIDKKRSNWWSALNGACCSPLTIIHASWFFWQRDAVFLHEKWHTAHLWLIQSCYILLYAYYVKYVFCFFLSHTQLYREYITSSEMYSLHLTHPKWTHTRSSGQPCYSARGAVGGSVPCSRTPQSWYWRRILQQSLPDLRFKPTTFRLQVRLAIH